MSLVPKHIKNLSPYKPGRTIDSVKKKYNLMDKYPFNVIACKL